MSSDPQKKKKSWAATFASFKYKLKTLGLTVDNYIDMFRNQRGCCKICGVHQGKLPKRLYVDHCHATGKVRGLLCQRCNDLLARALDKVEILRSAIKYLEDSRR